MDSHELIKLFYDRAYEKFVNKQILDDKNYIVPRQQLTKYVQELISIPFIDFIDYLKHSLLERKVEMSDVTQFSSFSACEIEMCNALLWANNPGCQFVDIGRFFPDKIISKSDASYRRYGENHIKAASQLGLTFEYYNYWYLSCLGYIYPDLDYNVRKQLLARTITRNFLYQQMLVDILDHDVDPKTYIDFLPGSIIKRRLNNVCVFFDICLEECKKENVKIFCLIKSYEVYKTISAIELPQGINKNLRTFLSEFDYQTLSRDTTVELIKEFRKGDHEAYELLIKCYMRLVLVIAKSFIFKGVEYDDLIQEGIIGLVRAFKLFNVDGTVDFRNYATWWIMHSIRQALFSNSFLVQIPINVISLHKKVWAFINYFEREHGYFPSVNDIVIEEMHDTDMFDYVYHLPEDLNNMILNDCDFDTFENDKNLIDLFENNDYNEYIVNTLLSHLSRDEESIVRAFFGIYTEAETLESIGDKFGLSRERIRQIVVASLRNLRYIYENKDCCNKVKNVLFSRRVVNSFREASIGDRLVIPQNNINGIVIDIKRNNKGDVYSLKPKNEAVTFYDINGKLIFPVKDNNIDISLERVAFLNYCYNKDLPVSIENNKHTPDSEDIYKYDKLKSLNEDIIFSYYDDNAKVGDKIIYHSQIYTIIDKRSMGGFRHLVIKSGEGKLIDLHQKIK